MAHDKQIILTGDRTTGPLHLGHYVGSLRSRLDLQDRPGHEQFLLLADMQALTDNAYNPGKGTRNIVEVATDYLAVGIDPAKSRICLQSQLPALAELTQIYMNFAKMGHLERNPTVREEIRARGLGDSIPAGFFCYPVAQAADITAFKATLVPVGADQAPMMEINRYITRQVNRTAGRDILPEAQEIIPEAGRLPGAMGSRRCRNPRAMRSLSRPHPMRSAKQCARCTPTRTTCGWRIRGR
jgi:tryptophanyl-tRNA synthetase